MELDWETRPLSIHKPQWHPSQHGAGPSAASSSTAAAAAAAAAAARRRSSVLHTIPPGPPPSQPIPSVPSIPTLHHSGYRRQPETSAMDYHNGTSSMVHPYTRPAASANLAAVAAFSEARFHAAPSPTAYSPPPSSSSTEDLSDSPPPSMLRSTASDTSEPAPDRHLLSPTDVRSSTTPRPSSRRALTKALELAREAVRLDTNDDPYAAVMAYGQSVALLSEVMERVTRGEDGPSSHRRQNGRRRSVVAQEEEVRRLQSIHDTYASRMGVLSVIYSIPIPSYAPDSTYTMLASASADSTRTSSPSPTSQTSQMSDAESRRDQDMTPRHSSETTRHSKTTRLDGDAYEELDDMEAIGTAFSSSTSLPNHDRSLPPTPNSIISPPPHPYSSSSASVVTPTVSSNRISVASAVRGMRPRASSTLPPPAPPPTSLPPPAPSPAVEGLLPDASSSSTLRAPDVTRARSGSTTHKRTGSGGRLTALHEESDKFTATVASASIAFIDASDSVKPRGVTLLAAGVESTRESPPLPPIPSPSTPATPESIVSARNAVASAFSASEPSSPRMGLQFTTPRPRGGSTFSVREIPTPTNKQSLINNSTVMGTISQRRVKTSAPPSTTSSSPTESTASLASVPAMNRLTASTLPANTAVSLGMASRTRAASQPGRRPSVASANSYSGPGSTSVVGMVVPRKVSIPSRLNPHGPPQITVNTALTSPTLGTSSLMPLIPPPPIPHQNIPSAPLSPLPPTAPPDPLRKPYHMMTLLRQTMVSKTGGYVTRRLHVPQEVWSQGGAKLTNIPEKIRVVEVLCSALEDVQTWSAEYFGAGNVSSGMVLGIGSVGRKEGEAWCAKLEDFSSVCDGVVGNFGKKLGVGEGFVTKKSSGVGSWGGRLTRQFDKITNGKNLDSPAAYVNGLSALFVQVQILDEHTKAVSSQPVAPLYAAFPPDIRQALEYKLRHASEFFATVVLTFVIRDLALLLDKYVKKCEKWLAE